MDIARALLALLAVCVFAVWVIRFTASRFPRLGLTQGPVRVLQCIVLGPRRTLYLVRVGSRLLLLGFGETQGPVFLAEVDPQSVPSATAETTDPPNGITKWPRRVFGYRPGQR